MAEVLGVSLYRYSYEENKVYTTTADGLNLPVFFMPIHGSSTHYLTTTNGSVLVTLKWDGRSNTSTIVDTILTLPPDQYINSCFVAPNGDMYFGTYAPTLCNVEPKMPYYHYTKGGDFKKIASNFQSTVGSFLVGSTMYQMDGCAKTLNAFKWDSETGDLCNGIFQSFYRIMNAFDQLAS